MSTKVFYYNGTILTLNSTNDIIENGFLLIESGKISAIGKYDASQTLPDDAELVDLQGNLLMPGLVNAHTHAAMTIFRGLSDDLPLMDWLNNYIFPAEKNLTAEWVEYGTKLACLEMIRSGTTTVSDMYLFVKSAAQAFADSGLRALCGEALYDFPSPNYGPPEKGLEYTRELIEEWQGHPTVSIAINAHAPYTCSPDLLKSCKELADEFNLPLHIHLAETEFEVADIKERYGNTPLMHLESLGLVDERLLCAHMVHVTDEELELVKKKKVKVLHNPESNMKLASGFAPINRMLDMGITVGLGTDGCASNNNLDMFNEMDFAAKIHKGFLNDPTAVTDTQALRMATIEGAASLGLDEVTGSLEVGKSADMIVVDLSAPHLRPLYNHVSHVVYAASGSDVLHTMVAGKWLMKNREILVLDEQDIYAKIDEISQTIRAIVK